MFLFRKSPVTGEGNVMKINVTRKQLNAWESGKSIQDSFPNLTQKEKDFIKSGIIDEIERITYFKQENEGE